MKLNEILVLNNYLKSIIDNSDDNLKISSILKFKLLGVMNTIRPSVENFGVLRDEKIKEYGKEDEETHKISISKDDGEAYEKFQSDLMELLESDVDINIQKLKVDDVFDKGLPADYLVGLYPIIEE